MRRYSLPFHVPVSFPPRPQVTFPAVPDPPSAVRVVLQPGLQPGDEGRVTEVLEGLTQTPRFSLNLALLSPSERGACERLLPLLATSAQRRRGQRGRSGDVGGDGGGEEKGKKGEEGNIDDAEEQRGVTGGSGSEGERRREGERERRGREGERSWREGKGERRDREEEYCSETTVGYRDTEKPNQRIADLMQLYGIQPHSTQQ